MMRLGYRVKCEIGIISDTHGLLREEAIAALSGVDAIIHAGDIGQLEVINTLQNIAPVHVIRGNIDIADWANDFPDELSVEIAQYHFHIIHNIKQLDIENLEDKFDIVISGHSHQPNIAYKQGRLFINPGSAGPRRFRLPICLARLSIINGELSPRIIELVEPT